MSAGTRLSGSLPVSVAAHLLAVGLLLVVPLLADMTLPAPALSPPAYVRALPVPAPASASRPRTTTARPGALPMNPDVAPLSAPSSILPERDFNPSDPMAMDGGVAGGVPPDLGVVVPDAARVIDPPPGPKPAATVRAAELPQPPRKLVDVRPAYPELARTARVQGTVVLEAIIDRTGRVGDVHVIRSVPMLDQAAIDAVLQWRYSPSTLRGQPVSVLMTITINFTLQ